MRRLLDISFRAKLLIALVGSVGLLGLASMAVVRHETTRQIAWTVERTVARSQQALDELERFRRADLERIAQRFTGSIRIAAALDAAIEDDSRDEFVEHVQYELTLAELEHGLVGFTDGQGRPVLTLVDGEPARDSADVTDFVSEILTGGDEAASGYRLFEDRLFAVQGHRIELFGEPVGTLTLGFPVDDEVMGRLGEIVEADICFAAAGRCVAGTPATRSLDLADRMLAAAGADQPVLTSSDGRPVALVGSPLAAADGIISVIAVPLEEVLAPFDRIERAERIAALVALVLALVLGSLLSKGLATPIRTLVAATARVRQGDYDFSVRVPHRDELGTLAEAFNQMTEGLLLKERYRGVLDKVMSPHIADELLKGDIRLGGAICEVTTLFSDIRGFTALTERMAPEDVIAMLNEWLELAAESIEREGGVVDKYVGDQVMAIFGAPIAQDDHAAHAVRAGLRLRALTDELSRARVARGDRPLAIGIGINTGPAVAGNTGSSKRLNYTALGASVNAAARLCGEAGPGELLIGEDTYTRVADRVEATRLPPRIPKGFSHPTTPYAVHGLRAEDERPTAAPRASHLAALLVALGAWLCLPPIASAQPFDLPTLSDLGIEYVSPEGRVQIRPSMRIDLDGYFPQDEPAWHIDETDWFLAGRARLFVDAFVGRHVYASTELRVDRGQPARAGSLEGHLQQAFVRLTPVPGTNFSVQGGKFVSPFGSYPQRAHLPADPFIRPPLPYDYRTVMSPDFVPAASDGVFTWKDDPALRREGLPIVWAVPYPVGAMAMGGGQRWTVRGGIMNTAPSADPADWRRLRLGTPAGPSLVGHASYQIVPELRVGASYSVGSYMRREVEDASGPLDIDRQTQETWGLDATLTHGHLDVNAELLFNRWEVFRVIDDPRDVSYYVEARMTLAPGLFAAVRYNAIHFRDLERASGGLDRWDYDVRRWQLGAGYRLGSSTEVRGEYMINRTLDTDDPRDNLLSLQWRWSF